MPWAIYSRTAMISIHAPRVGSDLLRRPSGWAVGHFNPRSPCGERPKGDTGTPATLLFQSTLPVWGATKCAVFCTEPD